MDNMYKLYICGARGSRPVCGEEFLKFGGDTSCYLLKNNNHAVIIDCGTGLNNAIKLIQDCTSVDIIITHVHYDHILGLLGHFSFPKNAKVKFYGTFSKWSKDDIFKEFFKKPFWPVCPLPGKNIDCEYEEKVDLTENVTLTLYKSNHPDDASVVKLNIFDKILCVICDYEHGEDLKQEILENCDYLLYDGMICPHLAECFKGWGHSNWKECGVLAEKYNIKNTLIVHHCPTKTDDELEKLESQAKIEYPILHFARIGEIYEL